jgi:hypothetical protein
MRMDRTHLVNHIAKSVVTIARGAGNKEVERGRQVELDDQEGGRLRR